MLLQSQQLLNSDVLSLHTGRVIASTYGLIINPDKLEVVGFYCESGGNKDPDILLTQDVRDIAPGKLLVNSHEAVAPASELIRLKDLLDLKFTILDKQVKTESGKRLGKVEEYVVETNSFMIQKLYVKQSILKNLTANSLVIDRQQIIEVSNSAITVTDATVSSPAEAPAQIA
jgi:uncharacterized protein YrrD